MSLISEDKISQILERSNIVDIIGEYVDLKKSGASYKGLCPFHNEKTPSFTVDEKKQLFHCFGCGAGGDVVSFIMQKEGLNYPESLKFLAHKAGITIEYSNEENSIINKRKNDLYEINKDIMMFYYKNLLTDKDAINYLKNRGLSGKIVNAFMLGFAKDSRNDLYDYIKYRGYDEKDIEELGLIKKSSKGNYYDKYRNRIMFPIINHFGKVIGFGARAIAGEMPKYLNSPESDIFKKRYNLYGLNVYKKQSKKEMILVEGYMDVIALNHHGIDYATASLGTSLTTEQAKLMKRYSQEVYICYDEDNAGIKACDRAIEVFLEEGIKPKIIQLQEGKDPDDYIRLYGKDAFLEKMNEALDVYNYKYNKILNIYSNSKTNEKYEKLDLFIEFLANIDSDLTREIFINNVSSLFGIDKSTLNKAINKYSTVTRSLYKNNSDFNKEKEKKIIVESNPIKINVNELEILRLIFNQPQDYQEEKEFFDNSLSDKKIIDIRDFLLYKDVTKFKEDDEDYTYILDYIRDHKNPIVREELMDKIKLYNRKKKLEEIRSQRNLN